MPWHIGKHPECDKEFAVIKNDDDSLAGCHDTEEAAKRQIAVLYAQEKRGDTMQRADVSLGLEVKADEGRFSALVAAYTLDREGDMILPGAFHNSLERWRKSGKRIPVAWHHQVHDADSIVGWIDPKHIVETDDGLLVKEGQIDITSNRGKRVFELLKQDTMSWSFGYIVPPDGHKHMEDGTHALAELDLLEVTITPVPANADTMTLATKGFARGSVVPAGSTVELHTDLILTPEQMQHIDVKVSTAPWDGSASRFTDEQYARSCILDRAKCGDAGRDMPAKSRYSLPIREPGGALNKNAVHAAAARINQVQACDAAKSAAKNALRRAYGQIGEEAPEGLKTVVEMVEPDEAVHGLNLSALLPETSPPDRRRGREKPSRPPDPIKNEITRTRIELAGGITLNEED